MRRGEIRLCRLSPVVGHEQAGSRPCLLVSVDAFNQGPAGLVVVVPLTAKDRRQPLHVPIAPPEGGVRKPSWAKCEDVRSVSKERLGPRWGDVSTETMAAIADRLRMLLDL